MNTTITTFAQLLAERPLIFWHMVTALVAFALGAVLLARRKGTTAHRSLGWVWVLSMGTAAVTSAFIRDTALPNLFGFTPIHAFTVLVCVNLPRGILAARQGNLVMHRKAMRGMYIGGCVLAGLFTLLPGRFLGHWVWSHLGLMA